MVKEIIQQSTPPTIDYLLFYVNGKQIIEHHIEPDWTILWYLRNSMYSSIKFSFVYMYMYRIEFDWI